MIKSCLFAGCPNTIGETWSLISKRSEGILLLKGSRLFHQKFKLLTTDDGDVSQVIFQSSLG